MQSGAIEFCETTGYLVGDHFRDVTKVLKLGSGAERLIDDFMLTREHVQNNESVRDMLGQRGIKPEQLPAEEDIKKLRSRYSVEIKSIREEGRT